MSSQNWAVSPLPFLPGQELCQHYYQQAVLPILQRGFPDLPHTAALVGYGSDVLGYDTPLSRDHMWGPRLVLFLPEAAPESLRAQLHEALRRELPTQFYGYPTHFSDPDGEGVRIPTPIESGPVDPLIALTSLSAFTQQELGMTPQQALTPADWLTLPEQRLLGVTAGRVYHDDLGLEALRRRLAYYPDLVWRYLLACQWMRLSQEEPFVGRTHSAGDELGSRLITARLCQDVMRLAFLLERRYAPYSKWFGTAFQRLDLAAQLFPCLQGALEAPDFPRREAQLCSAYETLARAHNALGLTPALDPSCSLFHQRPFRVLHAERFAAAVQETISDPWLRALPLYGGLNQYCTTTDILESPAAWRRLQALYGG